MKTKNYYYTLTIEENGKYYAYVQKVANCNNLLGAFPKNAIHINLFGSKKESEEIARVWNTAYKQNGTNLY